MPEFTVSGSHQSLMMEFVIEQMIIEAEYMFSRAELEISILESQGAMTTAATSTMTGVFLNEEAFVKAFMNRNAGLIDEMHSKMIAEPVSFISKQHPERLYEWVLDGSANHCASCLEGADLGPATIEQIQSLGWGLPREGATICKVGCKCMLDTVK